MKKFLCILFAALLLAALAGCSSAKKDEEKIVGSWKTEVSLASIAEDLKDTGMEEYFQFDGLTMNLQFTFREDGTYLLEAAEFDKTVSAMRDMFSKGMESYMKKLAETTGISYEDMMQGSSLEKLVDELVGEMLDPDEVKTEGKYRLSEGKLFMTEGEDAFDEKEYTTYTFESDTKLKFLEAVSEDADEKEAAKMLGFPLTLTKQ